VIPVIEEADGAFVATVFTTAFHFDDITTSTEDLPIEAYTICDSRHGYTGITEGPLASMELMHPAPGIATSVGGVVPGVVLQKLLSRGNPVQLIIPQ
jgi:hypothetical protein